ncbi:YtxH domain-containing protein [Brevibacterium aurantiacum]|uniref:YtxH domain-containing protein n=1 Tax=Brevibacterium aurantiacum TaxID=273384 RepID=UPI00186733CA|nr:YtxH domain-containing protein [Brevibacterium aurantiacum]
MKKRLILLAGLGVGYVLGSRTGRQSYEKLKAQAQDLWTDPRVQDTVEKANQSIREKSPAVADAVQTAADKVNSAAGTGSGAAGAAGTGSAGSKSTGTPPVKDDVIADPERDLDDEGPAGLSEDT